MGAEIFKTTKVHAADSSKSTSTVTSLLRRDGSALRIDTWQVTILSSGYVLLRFGRPRRDWQLGDYTPPCSDASGVLGLIERNRAKTLRRPGPGSGRGSLCHGFAPRVPWGGPAQGQIFSQSWRPSSDLSRARRSWVT
jgi:hypothetical protein